MGVALKTIIVWGIDGQHVFGKGLSFHQISEIRPQNILEFTEFSVKPTLGACSFFRLYQEKS